MLIKIIKTTVCGGKNVTAGLEINADDRESALLIRMGMAEQVRETLTLKVEPEVPVKKKSKRKSKVKEE